MEYIGIDIGSTCAKVAVLDEDENILHQSVQTYRMEQRGYCRDH